MLKNSASFFLVCLVLPILIADSLYAQKKHSVKQKNSTYVFITPPGGMHTIPVWSTNSTIKIKWSGGSADSVNLILINFCSWAVERSIVSNIANNGSYSWTIPKDLNCGVYEVYIEQAKYPPSEWHYSSNFAITKDSYLNETRKNKPFKHSKL